MALGMKEILYKKSRLKSSALSMVGVGAEKPAVSTHHTALARAGGLNDPTPLFLWLQPRLHQRNCRYMIGFSRLRRRPSPPFDQSPTTAAPLSALPSHSPPPAPSLSPLMLSARAEQQTETALKSDEGV